MKAAPLRRILVVEDEWIIAEMLQDTLEKAGFTVLGPAGTTADARKIIEQEKLDAAVLDVSLRGDTSFAIARLLADKSVPFVFVTGYVGNDLPEEFKGRPVLQKPVDDQNLLRSVNTFVSQ